MIVRLCKDCRFLGTVEHDTFPPYPLCNHPLVIPDDLVYGTKPFAMDERQKQKDKQCGPEGALWEPKL